MREELKVCGIELQIQHPEQYKKASISRKNCNPGNLKNLKGEFIKYNDFNSGFYALCDYLKRVASGQHKSYPKGGETTLVEFQKIYSPESDNNKPYSYATFIATQLKITIDTPINNLL